MAIQLTVACRRTWIDSFAILYDLECDGIVATQLILHRSSVYKKTCSVL